MSLLLPKSCTRSHIQGLYLLAMIYPMDPGFLGFFHSITTLIDILQPMTSAVNLTTPSR